jgi:hypothetical protein
MLSWFPLNCVLHRMYLVPSATFDLHAGGTEATNGGAWRTQTITPYCRSVKRPSNYVAWEPRGIFRGLDGEAGLTAQQTDKAARQSDHSCS